MKKRLIFLILASVFMAVTLVLTVSAFLQFLSTKNIQDHSTYVNGKITNLTLSRPDYNSAPTKFGGGVTSVTQDPGFFVSYSFVPKNSTQAYSKTYYGVSESTYYNFRMGGSIKIYYDTQKPSVSNPDGYQSSVGQLGVLTAVFGIAFVASLVVFILIKNHKQSPPSAVPYDNNSYSNAPPMLPPTVNNPETVEPNEQGINDNKL